MKLEVQKARAIVLLTGLALVGGCATTGPATDPYEGFNRAMFSGNRAVDKAVVRPGAVVYRTVTPIPARRGLSRILENLTEPWSAINALLQGKPKRALNSLGRFVINTTIGVGGLADHATGLGLKPTREDFGQTLATWGVKDGGYLVLPLFGPSTVRDGVGISVGMVADPQNIAISQIAKPKVVESAAIAVARAISARSDFVDSGGEEVLNTSADAYATARSAYFQRRAVVIADQENATPSAETDLDAVLNEIDAQPGATPPPDPVDPIPPVPETPQED